MGPPRKLRAGALGFVLLHRSRLAPSSPLHPSTLPQSMVNLAQLRRGSTLPGQTQLGRWGLSWVPMCGPWWQLLQAGGGGLSREVLVRSGSQAVQ